MSQIFIWFICPECFTFYFNRIIGFLFYTSSLWEKQFSMSKKDLRKRGKFECMLIVQVQDQGNRITEIGTCSATLLVAVRFLKKSIFIIRRLRFRVQITAKRSAYTRANCTHQELV